MSADAALCGTAAVCSGMESTAYVEIVERFGCFPLQHQIWIPLGCPMARGGDRGSGGAGSTGGSAAEEKALLVIQCLLSRFSLIYDIQIQKKKRKRIPHTYEISAFSR